MNICVARSEKRKRRRHVIMDAAYQLFLEHGYSNVSMTDIIRRSGGSLSTAYELFENKNGLLRAIVTEHFAELHETISNIVKADDPPDRALKHAARDFLHTLLDSGGVTMLRIIVAESLRDPAFGQYFRASASETAADVLTKAFQKWDEQGYLKVDDPRQAAESFFALLVHKVQMLSLCGLPVAMTEDEIDRHITHVVRMICHCYDCTSTPRQQHRPESVDEACDNVAVAAADLHLST